MDSPEYIADWVMTKLKDATADCESDMRKQSLEELKRLCDTELANIAEVELDMKTNPQFYT